MPPISMRNHSIWSATPIAVTDGETGASFSANQLHNARAIIAWSDQTREAYFQAHAIVAAAAPVHYNFALVAVGSANDDLIEGLFDIWRGGTRVVTGGVGRLYGLNQPASVPGGPANYFKLYVGSSSCYAETWHFGAYIDHRIDYL